VTAEEYAAIIASEKNPEKRAYYEFLYETGAAQSDAAELTAENIDWQHGLLVYHRKKLGPDSERARLSIGQKFRELLESLPVSGDLFPTIKRAKPNARSTEFRRRCRIIDPQDERNTFPGSFSWIWTPYTSLLARDEMKSSGKTCSARISYNAES
jgi:integrase